MAGIGFVLRELDRRDSLLAPLAQVGHGSFVAAGPWIFCVASIALIHRGTAMTLTPDASFAFRGFVIYAFAISLLVTQPIVNVATRMVADELYLREFRNVRPRYLAALIASCGVSGLAAALLLGPLMGLTGANLVLGILATTVVGIIWPTLAFCGAVRDYRGITAAFVLGLMVSITATIIAARMGWGAPQMIVTFVAGLAIVFFWLASRVLATFPHPVEGVGRHLLDLGYGMRRHWMLALASLLAIAAIWADKWVIWFSVNGVALDNGLISAPFYDGAMFIAYLVMIPALGLFVTAIETSVFEDYRSFLDAVQGHAPLSRIEKLSTQFENRLFSVMQRILATLGVLCALAIMLSPLIVPYVGLQYQQIGVLRLGFLAAFFQFMFLTCVSILLFFDLHGRFLALQALFLVLQVTLTLATLWLGSEYLGYGHLLACAFSALVAVGVLSHSLRRIAYLTFAAALRQPPRAKAAPSEPRPGIAATAGQTAAPAAAPAKEATSTVVMPTRITTNPSPLMARPRPLLRP